MAKRRSFLKEEEQQAENPEITHRKQLAQEDARIKKESKPVDTFYKKIDGKIVKITKMNNGNSFSSYVGLYKDKDARAFYDKAKADGLVRND